MRPSLLRSVGVMALGLTVPSVAWAHHGHRHYQPKVGAKADHAKFRLMHIAEDGTGASRSPALLALPTAPEHAGTVVSYVNDILALRLGDGSTISGKVTSDTRIYDTSLLVPGAVLRAAELRIGPGGGEFGSVWLVS